MTQHQQQWHPELFHSPRGAAAEHMVELRARRQELRAQQAEAARRAQAAREQAQTLKHRIAGQEARETAFGKDAGGTNAKTLNGQLGKLDAEIATRNTEAAKFARAVEAVDAETETFARANDLELQAELRASYDEAAGRYAEALRELEAAGQEARTAAASMLLFIQRVHPEISHELREIAPNRTLRDVVATARAALPGSLWINSAHDRWAHEEHAQRVEAARQQVEAEVNAGKRRLATETMGESGMSDAIREVIAGAGEDADSDGWQTVELGDGGTTVGQVSDKA